MKQFETPLFDCITKFQREQNISFHVPGHKHGKIFLTKGKEVYSSLLSVDLTELTGLDDLHAPVGPIRAAEHLLRDLYGARNSYFLVNGSTVGNLAMILATCDEGDYVFVQRNCHQSILHGLMLADVIPIFLTPEEVNGWGIAGGLTFTVFEEAIKKFPAAKALILTYPNYYGLASPIELQKITNFAHENKIHVLVDEAHGAHFTLDNPFPPSSLKLGADLVVQSAHKTLPAMTMGSYLHVTDEQVDVKRIEFYLQMLQSSSPSYPIMGSLDLARAYVASYTAEDKLYLLKEREAFIAKLLEIPEIEVLTPPNHYQLDPLKITIRSKCGLTGYQLQNMLEKVGVYIELADPQNVLLVFPLLKVGDSYPFHDTVRKIRFAVKGKTGYMMHDKNNRQVQEKVTTINLPYGKIKHAKTKQVTFREAIGEIAGEMVIPYPPGIPLLMIGEQIRSETVEMIDHYLSLQARFHGGSGLHEKKLVIIDQATIQ